MTETPAWLEEIFTVRRSIGDPNSSDLVFAEELPETATPNTAYTTGDGEYFYFDVLEWRRYTLKTSDAYIGLLLKQQGRIRASIQLVDYLIAQIDPADYITSGNAGGQSVSFLSLQEIIMYYNVLRDHLLEEEAAEAGMNSGLMLATKRRPVGGVLEEDE